MLTDLDGRHGFRFDWKNCGNSFDHNFAVNLQEYLNTLCNPLYVFCKIFLKNKYPYSEEKECYIVFSIHSLSDDLNVKQLYIRNKRSNNLFYTDYHIVKQTDDSDLMSLVDAGYSYCQTVDFLRKLFCKYSTSLPRVIHGDEITGLKEYNAGCLNMDLSISARIRYEKGLKKFFIQENTRSKYLQKWRAFSRTDKYDRKASFWKMFRDFHNRDSQITDLELLRESNDNLKTTVINEHEFIKFQKDLKRLYPDVLYSVSGIEVENGGFDKRNKHKPIEKIRNGPFGKLVTYEAYCDVMEKRFATEGFEALKDLNPTYYETRQLTYKEIDEPFIASVLNSIRFSYAKSDGLHKVQVPGTEIVSYIDIPVDDMMNFVSLAKANHLDFYLDCFGKFGKANFEKLRVVYNPFQDEMMHKIGRRIIEEKFNNLKRNSTSLTKSRIQIISK